MPRGPEKEEGMEKLSVSILQMWTYRPQKRQVGSAFALTYILLLRSCKLMGVFYHRTLASLMDGVVVAQQQGLFAPRALPRFNATTGPSATLSSSPDFPVLPVIQVPVPPISRRDEEGFSSCSVHPCHRAVATAPSECHAASASLRRSMLPAPYRSGLGL